jgi:hypothetical protein
MKVPPFSVSDHEASALKPPQPVADKDPAQHPENDAIKQQAPDQVAKEEAERSAAAAQQRQTREQIPDTNAVAPPNERSTGQPQPIVMRKLASGTTAAPLHAVADVERSPDVATELSPMKAPPFSAMAHHEASPLKQQPIGGEDPTQHREGDAIKQPAPAPVAKEEAERSAAAPQQRQIHEKIPDTNAVAPPNERSTRQSPKRKAVAQFWQCLPRPPTGEVVCRPITRRSRQ